jgi:hypothetical protein
LLAALAGILSKVNGLPIHLWVPVGLAVLVLGMIACLLALSLKEQLARGPLEIVFDASNVARRFWRRVQAKDKDGNSLPITGREYRVGIVNQSNRTVRNVRVSVETLGQMPVDPRDIGFLKDQKDSRDIAPGYTELVPIWWVWPPQPGDAWGPTATSFHGPVRVIARGDDAKAVEKIFDYLPQQEPVLVERRAFRRRKESPTKTGAVRRLQ